MWAREFPFWRGACTLQAGGTARFDITLLRGGKAETAFDMTSLAADQPPIVLHAK